MSIDPDGNRRSGPDVSLLAGLLAILRRDLRIAGKRAGDWLNPLVFFLMVSTLFPLALGPDPEQLSRFGPGVLWVAALLSALLSLNGLFQNDYDDGTLDQLLLSPQPLPLISLAKTVAHWLVSGLPLVLVSPLIALSFGMPVGIAGVLLVTLLLGTLTLSLLGAVGAALTVALKHGSALFSLIILPLTMPVLIFGARTVSLAAAGDTYAGGLYALAAMGMIALVLTPFAAAVALKVSIE